MQAFGIDIFVRFHVRFNLFVYIVLFRLLCAFWIIIGS